MKTFLFYNIRYYS